MNWMLPLLIAATAGALMAWQGSLNAMLGRELSLLHATFIVHGLGAVAALLLLIVVPHHPLSTGRWAQAPWYAYLGGLLGVGIIWGVARSIPPVGVANATAAIIVGQVLTASVIDHLGLLGLRQLAFTPARGLGAGLMALGAWLLLKR